MNRKTAIQIITALCLVLFFSQMSEAQQSVATVKFPIKEIWRYQTISREVTDHQKTIFLSPQTDYLRVFYAGTNGTCGALFKRTGELSWRFSSGESFNNGLILFDNGPLVVAGLRSIYALNPENGLLIWMRKHDDALSTPITKSGSNIVVADDKNNLLCLNTSDGGFRWQITLPSQIRSKPLVHDSKLFCGAEDGTVFCISAEDGRQLWQIIAGGAVRSGFAVSDQWLFFGATDKYLYCVDATSGKLRWKNRAAGQVNGYPVCDGDSLFIAPNDRTLRVFKVGNGHPRRGSPFGLSKTLWSRPLLIAEQLLFPQGKELIAISTESLRREGTFSVPSEITAPALFDPEDRVFYLGCRDGTIVAVASEADSKPTGTLPQAGPVERVATIPQDRREVKDKEETTETKEEKQSKPTETKDEAPKAEDPAKKNDKAAPEEGEVESPQVTKADAEKAGEDETVKTEEKELNPEKALEQAKTATAEGDLQKAAALWKIALKDQAETKYTVTTGLFCTRESASFLLEHFKDREIMVFERRVDDNVCFFICIGLFSSRDEAVELMNSIDSEKLEIQPAVYRLDSFIF